ncbi:MAG: hypothetical protein KC900_09245 [Candidatus Omnitrophica bacterium]|nr:hypothetical protein [Candidatus Omnitrophota bacterium]
MPSEALPLNLVFRILLTNVVPFFLLFHMIMQRRRQLRGEPASHVRLVAGELTIVGLLGYYVILSAFFVSIPVMDYMNDRQGYRVMYVAPEGSTVYVIAAISFYLVCAGIFLQRYHYWAYRLAVLMVMVLIMYAFFSVLHYGPVALVPVTVFVYLLFRLTREELVNELESNLVCRKNRNGGNLSSSSGSRSL